MPNDAVLGFSTAHVLTGTVNLAGYTPEQGATLYARLQGSLESIPGVLAANIVDSIPLTPMKRPDRPFDAHADNGRATSSSSAEQVHANTVSPGHFQTLSIPLLRGRDFQAADNAGNTQVCIVNEGLAKYFWPNENPIDKHIQLGHGPWLEVVGVVHDSKYLSLDEVPRLFLYRPLGQNYDSATTLLIKTAGQPQALSLALQKAVTDLDPNLVAYDIQPLEDRIGLILLPNRAATIAATILGIVGLGLGLIGTFGTMSFVVQQRRKEIGVRLALGATPRDVTGLIAGQGMKWPAAGIAIGLCIASAASLMLRRLMFGISPLDPAAFIGVSALLAGVAYLACYVPACRASLIDPLSALRDE